MKKINLELVVGFFSVIGVLCLGRLAVVLGKKEILGSDHYSVFADFESNSGLRENAEIEIAGVRIGAVARIFLSRGGPRGNENS